MRLALRALFAHRLRALLALSSITIGVLAVVLLGAIGAGAQRDVVQRMAALGTNLIVVRPAAVQRSASRKTIAGTVTTLRVEDFEAIAALPFVTAAAPDAERPVRAKAGRTTTLTKILGTTPAYPRVRNFRIRAGRFFDADDDAHARRVAVLGAQVADALFDGANPIGRELRVRGVPFDVIGVMERKGVMPDGSDEDNEILVPLRTALRRVLNVTWLNGIFVSVDDPSRADAVREVMRERSGVRRPCRRCDRGGAAAALQDDFVVQNTLRLVQMQQRAAGALTLLAAGIGGVALLVGGAGILALMLMSVRERTGEIGVRMAVGATPRDILLQFLFESTLLAAGGWLLGVAGGAIAAVIVAAATQWTIAVPLDALLASAAMVLLAGVGFGLVPARQASRLAPMDALRSV
jgi:putative ABC transport system permease protein